MDPNGDTPAPTLEAVPDAPTTDTPDAPAQADKDWMAEAEKWQALARKHEQRARENAAAAKELQALRESQMSDLDKAVAEAESRGREAALSEVTAQLADAKFRAAAAGKVANIDTVIDLIDVRRFVGEDGVDESAIAEAVERLSASYPAASPPKFPAAQLGPARNDRPGQLTRDDLKGMSPEAIAKAKNEGRLNDLLGITT